MSPTEAQKAPRVALLIMEPLRGGGGGDCGVHPWGLLEESGPQCRVLAHCGSLPVLTQCPGARRPVFTKQAWEADVDTSHFLKCVGPPPPKESCKQQIRRIEV